MQHRKEVESLIKLCGSGKLSEKESENFELKEENLTGSSENSKLNDEFVTGNVNLKPEQGSTDNFDSNPLKVSRENSIYEEYLTESLNLKQETSKENSKLSDELLTERESNSNSEKTVEKKENCQQQIDKELAHQSTKFQEQLQNTIKNLEVNDKDRLEEMRRQCLEAMDVHQHLMACRQITEMMQLLATQRKQNQRQMMKNEHKSIIGEASSENSQHNQSK